MLVADDELLQQGVSNAFQEYNTEQFTATDMPGQKYKVLVSKHGHVGGNRFIDPRSKQTFAFDHMRQIASDPEPSSEAEDPQRAGVDTAVQAYIAEHYPAGVSATYGHSGSIVICIVDNKYNPRNYWFVSFILSRCSSSD